ncbi:hypothetical protein L1887_53645 [Cichorium endivia]|nr:hypothetical protein L1887_53645 [Cichorium endivia]
MRRLASTNEVAKRQSKRLSEVPMRVIRPTQPRDQGTRPTGTEGRAPRMALVGSGQQLRTRTNRTRGSKWSAGLPITPTQEQQPTVDCAPEIRASERASGQARWVGGDAGRCRHADTPMPGLRGWDCTADGMADGMSPLPRLVTAGQLNLRTQKSGQPSCAAMAENSPSVDPATHCPLAKNALRSLASLAALEMALIPCNHGNAPPGMGAAFAVAGQVRCSSISDPLAGWLDGGAKLTMAGRGSAQVGGREFRFPPLCPPFRMGGRKGSAAASASQQRGMCARARPKSEAKFRSTPLLAFG